jgi:sugar phosphate isomerase/epimerase
MKLEQVAAITSSIGRFMKTPPDIAANLEKIRQIGYQAVQISGIGEIDTDELASICRDLDLKICATHEKNVLFRDEPQSIIEKLGKLGCVYAGYPFPHTGPIETIEHVREVIDALNHAGKVLAEAGMTVVYHNHQIEFQRYDGKVVLDMIYDQTDPKTVQGEPDTYWIQFGGADPVQWCRKLSGRLPVLHMKDYAMGSDRQPIKAPIGSGNLDWSRIVPAAEEAGCEWFVVEQDGGTLEGLAESFAYIRDNLVGG